MKYTFPIVGIGCSAGSLKALETFFENVSDKPDMSFIIVKHMDPTYKTELISILAKNTNLEIKFMEEKEKIAKDIAYIVPPGKNASLKEGKFYLKDPEKPRGQRLPIDFFFRSLGKELENKSIGVLMSGTGTDGTLGLREIKGRGGIAVIQDPKEAEYPGMLKSAASHVNIDYVLSIDEIPKQLTRYVKNYAKPFPKMNYTHLSQQLDRDLNPILQVLKRNKGQEILVYKNSTLSRRISKRMAVNNIAQIKEYAQYLKHHPTEIRDLFSEILIGVTEFFRDKSTFEKLKDLVIPKIVSNKDKNDKIRIWIVGCSTGEEAYSIAILLKEYLDKKQKNNKVMIFASDPNEVAISRARSGVYPENVGVDIKDKYLEEYFNQEDSTYKVKKEIRNMIIFSVHNVITDPPFSDLDLISCRNLLIFLKIDIQKKLFDIFHYSLKKEGYLFLGNSESVRDFSKSFSEVAKNSKIYKKEEKTIHRVPHLRAFPPLIDHEITIPTEDKTLEKEKEEKEELNYQKLMNNLILKEYSPSSIIINADNEIIYIHGRTGKYLEPPVGKAKFNILKMARKGLDIILTTAIKKARNLGEEIKFKNIDIKSNGDKIRTNLIVRPIRKRYENEKLLLIVFEESFINSIDLTENKFENITDKMAQRRIKQLENELEATRSHLKATVEELENANKRLQSANEEYQSSNEELKSTSEELQSSREELQSVNEELMSVNNELENKIRELTRLNNDLNNLIRSSQISTIFLGPDLEIKRFTPPVKEIFRVIDNDLGRNIRDISSKLKYDNLIDDILKVQKDLNSIEKDVETESDKWYRMRIMPYKSEEGRIKGVILTFFDITEKKITREKLKKSEKKYREAYKRTEFYQDLVTHDFNNLLTILNLSCNQLKANIEGKDRETVELMEEQIKRGAKLVESIQKLTRIDKRVAQTTPLDLIDMIKKQISIVEKDFAEENIEIKFDYPEDSLIVYASKFLDEAIQNLLNNAIVHNESEVKRINIKVGNYKQKDNEFYKISIEDNGIGIRDQQKEIILEERPPIKDNTSRGLGIGLSIVKKLIKISNGEIWIENRIEGDYTKGSRVVLLLPKYERSE
ncbi:MAG: CheR family methyltransferase [Promethearchaeia archaeon]